MIMINFIGNNTLNNNKAKHSTSTARNTIMIIMMMINCIGNNTFYNNKAKHSTSTAINTIFQAPH